MSRLFFPAPRNQGAWREPEWARALLRLREKGSEEQVRDVIRDDGCAEHILRQSAPRRGARPHRNPAEFAFRYNPRSGLAVKDMERTDEPGFEGKGLTYRRTGGAASTPQLARKLYNNRNNQLVRSLPYNG